MLTPGEVGFTVAIVQLVSTINPTLAAGQKYFLQLSSTGLTSSSRWIWNVNNQGVNGWAQGSTSGWAFSNNAAPAFAVYGADAVDTGIPEPVPAALLGTGLLLGLLHRRSARSGVCNPNQ